jgi:hypothetical protein
MTDNPPGTNASDCPECSGKNLPYPWICKGHPAAYARAMQIARDGSEPSAADLEVFRVAITQGWRPRLDDLSDDHLDVIYSLVNAQAKEIAGFLAREQPETWNEQSNEIGRLVMALQNSEGEATGARQELSDLRLRLHQLADDLTKPTHANIPPHMIAGAIWAAIEAPALDDTPEQP